MNVLNIFKTISAYLKKLSGSSGYRILSDANLHLVRTQTIIPREDTVIASLLLDGVEVVAVANTNVDFNIASVTLLANIDILTAPLGHYFTSITLTSGSVGVFTN